MCFQAAKSVGKAASHVSGKSDSVGGDDIGGGQSWLLVKQQEQQERRRLRQQKQQQEEANFHSLPAKWSSNDEAPFEQEGLLTQRSTSTSKAPLQASNSSGDSGEDLKKYIKMVSHAPGTLNFKDKIFTCVLTIFRRQATRSGSEARHSTKTILNLRDCLSFVMRRCFVHSFWTELQGGRSSQPPLPKELIAKEENLVIRYEFSLGGIRYGVARVCAKCFSLRNCRVILVVSESYIVSNYSQYYQEERRTVPVKSMDSLFFVF